MDESKVIDVDSIPPESNGHSSELTQHVHKRDAHGRLLPGQPHLPGAGRPKNHNALSVRAIKKMLRREHANLAATRELFARLRQLAMGEMIVTPVMTANGEITLSAKMKADPGFMKLYLERVYGQPTSPLDEADFDMSDAPDEVLNYLHEKLKRG